MPVDAAKAPCPQQPDSLKEEYGHEAKRLANKDYKLFKALQKEQHGTVENGLEKRRINFAFRNGHDAGIGQ